MSFSFSPKYKISFLIFSFLFTPVTSLTIFSLHASSLFAFLTMSSAILILNLVVNFVLFCINSFQCDSIVSILNCFIAISPSSQQIIILLLFKFIFLNCCSTVYFNRKYSFVQYNSDIVPFSSPFGFHDTELPLCSIRNILFLLSTFLSCFCVQCSCFFCCQGGLLLS